MVGLVYSAATKKMETCMFQKAIDAVNAKYPSPSARAAFNAFKRYYLGDKSDLLDSMDPLVFHPIVSRRYHKEETRIMCDPKAALTAVPIVKEGVVLSDAEILKAQTDGYYAAWQRSKLSFKSKFAFALIVPACLFLIAANSSQKIAAYVGTFMKEHPDIFVPHILLAIGISYVFLSHLASDFYLQSKKEKLGDIKKLVREREQALSISLSSG